MSALEGVVVLDLTSRFWSSMACALLGDFGADVIKVEAPTNEERRRGDDGEPHETGTWNWRFDLTNRNKRSLGVDLNTDRGAELFRELVAKADVVVTDAPASELVETGRDYASLAAIRDDLIYVRGSGFGNEGPDKDVPAIDELAAARAGMMPILGQPGQPPVYPGHGQMYTSVMIALGATLALFHRRATGEGQEVATSLLAGNMYGASLDLQAFLAIGGERFLNPVSRLDAGNPMSGTQYPTEDGLWATLTMPETDRWWPVLAEILDLDVADPRFDTHEKRCEVNRLEMMQVLDGCFRKHPAAHWRTIFNEKQMSADIIEDYRYPAGDDSARDNRYILDMEDPSFGALSMLGFPVHMSDTPASLDRSAPLLGQHSTDVLHGILGYEMARIMELRSEGVIV